MKALAWTILCRQLVLPAQGDECLAAASPRRRAGRAGHVRDPPVSQRDQVVEHQAHALLIVVHDAGKATVAEAAVDQHGGQPVTLHGVEQRIADLRRQDQEAAHLAMRERRDEVRAGVRLVRGVCHQAHESPAAQLDLDSGDQGAEQGVPQVGHEHADQLRLLGAQRCGDRVRQVAQLAGDALDALPRRLGHLAADAAQRPRHRSRMDAGLAGDVGDGDRTAARSPWFDAEFSQTIAFLRFRQSLTGKPSQALPAAGLSTTFKAIDCPRLTPVRHFLLRSWLRARAGDRRGRRCARSNPVRRGRAQEADLIVINAKVATLDGQSRIVQGLAVREGRIAAVGATADVRKLAGPRTRILDAGGRTVIPGLIDSHMHAVRAALSYSVEVNWIDARTIPEAMARLRSAAERSRPGAWLVVAGGWTEQQFEERRRPTPQEVLARRARTTRCGSSSSIRACC